MRFVGQRVAAVVAETEGAAEEGCRLLEVEYELLPAVFDPELAMEPDAPILHEKKSVAYRDNIYVDIHGELGNVEQGFKEADAIHEMTYRPRARSTCISRRTARIAWRGEDGRLHVRTSSQAPFIAKQKLCYLFGLFDRDVHVFTERIGGGFGGKQEMLSEDLCALATLKTGRPVMWEFTRQEEFIGATTRHPMTTHVKLGAKKDGTLTAIQVRVVSNTGAYGNHGGETLAAALGSPIAAYRCPNKKADGYAVYTNMVPAGGFSGYGATQTTFAIECAMDDLARLLGMDPFTIRRINKVRATDRIESIWQETSDVKFGSYGIDQCLDLVEKALKSGRGLPKPDGDDWLEGTGIAVAMLDSGPPTEHRSGAEMRLLPDGSYHLAVGSTEMGNGSTTSHRQIAATVLNTAREPHRHRQWRHRQDALRHGHVCQHGDGRCRPGGGEGCGCAPRYAPRICQPAIRAAPPADCRLEHDAVICGNKKLPLAELYAQAPPRAIASTSFARPISRRVRSASTFRAFASRFIASRARSCRCRACTRPISARR